MQAVKNRYSRCVTSPRQAAQSSAGAAHQSWKFGGLSPAVLVALLLLVGGQSRILAQILTQTYTLRQGWNAVYLDVVPTNTTAEIIFKGLPVLSAWRPQDKSSSVEFISDPSEPVWNRDQWLVYVPTNRAESIDNNLFQIEGGRPYLIQLSAAANWVVAGTPHFGSVRWKADAYNLKGFPIDAELAPTFSDFFQSSPAHFSATDGGLQPIYQLSAAGRWDRVDGSDLMDPHAAYWVYCKGPSQFVAPIEVRTDAPDGVDFDRALRESVVRVVNRSSISVTASVAEQGAPGPTVLTRGVFDAQQGVKWDKLPPILVASLGEGESLDLRLAPDRTGVSDSGYASYLDIRDNAGTRFQLPIRVRKLTVATAGLPVAQAAAARLAGLWSGVISVKQVSEAHSGQLVTTQTSQSGEPLQIERQGISDVPTPVQRSFDLRVLLHVSETGQTRLLHEVWQMWQDGTYKTQPDGSKVTDKPGRYVLITEEPLLSQFQSAILKDGRPANRRLSSAAFYFPPGPAGNQILLGGLFGINQTNGGGYLIPSTDPRNPYLHRFHPDHDNLDNTEFKDFKREAFDISRQFQFEFRDWNTADGPRPPDYGYAVMSGVYRETVTGLHRQPISAQGTFRLRRVAESTELNPSVQR